MCHSLRAVCWKHVFGLEVNQQTGVWTGLPGRQLSARWGALLGFKCGSCSSSQLAARMAAISSSSVFTGFLPGRPNDFKSIFSIISALNANGFNWTLVLVPVHMHRSIYCWNRLFLDDLWCLRLQVWSLLKFGICSLRCWLSLCLVSCCDVNLVKSTKTQKQTLSSTMSLCVGLFLPCLRICCCISTLASHWHELQAALISRPSY